MADPLAIPWAVAIDAATTQDRDDAIWVARDGATLTVTVAITNVADAVPPGGPRDRRAAAGGRPDYGAGALVQPMLPAPLQRSRTLGAAPAQPVLAITAVLAADGTLTGTVQEGVLATTQVLTYPAAERL